MHAVGAEHVRELVRVEDDRRRAEREHEPRELVRKQLRRLEVHVRVDEAGNDVASLCVDDLTALVLAEPRDPAVGDGHVDVEPFACEDRQHPPSAYDDICRLIAPGDG